MAVDVQDLHIDIGGREIVGGVSLTVADGERVGLIGSSGSGKSMISKALLGLLPAESTIRGDIALGDMVVASAGRVGRDAQGSRDKRTDGDGTGYAVSDQQLADLRGRYVGTVFQNPAATLNPVWTVAKQVALPLRLHYNLPKADRLERVMAMLRKVGLPEEVAGKYPCELSGGQQQRVGLATALITSPRFIIADEPTTALDSITQRQIVDLLVSLVDDAGASMLFITHDFSVLARATTRCYVLDEGRVVEEGDTMRLLADPKTEQTTRLVEAARMLTLEVHHD